MQKNAGIIDFVHLFLGNPGGCGQDDLILCLVGPRLSPQRRGDPLAKRGQPRGLLQRTEENSFVSCSTCILVCYALFTFSNICSKLLKESFSAFQTSCCHQETSLSLYVLFAFLKCQAISLCCRHSKARDWTFLEPDRC